MSKAISRRSFLRASALTVGAAISANFLASCSPKETAVPEVEAPAAPAEAEVIQLRYSHWGNEDEKASTRAVLDAFEKEHPNIKVEQIYVPESGDAFLQKLNAMAASDSLPDGTLFPDGSTVDWGLMDMSHFGTFVGFMKSRC
jgi:ABC-type glycerol-3-phosphate transport system substrate-binding protein